MCGIFGGVSNEHLDAKFIKLLSRRACQRGQDSSGFITWANGHYDLVRSDFSILQSLKKFEGKLGTVFVGHSRLITQGQNDNQPVERDSIYVIHNGIVLNADSLWNLIGKTPKLEVDSEILPALASHFLEIGHAISDLPKLILDVCIGVVSAVLIFPELGKIMLISNNGSLYFGTNQQDSIYFASEKFPLIEIECLQISQVQKDDSLILDIPKSEKIQDENIIVTRSNLVPVLLQNDRKSKLLEYEEIELKRCSRCILPSTMPFIHFDSKGICNFCKNYVPRNKPKSPDDLYVLLDRYRKVSGPDCIFPFSGGRDSSFGLHLAVKEFGLKPIAYTYDWGMVTDLGRRNISLMCSKLGIENIVVAANINWKRQNIRKNLNAWLEDPNLGMLSILTAGDKHFFRHINDVRKQTDISMNLWSVNPLEVTHFKAGFLGVPPDFESKSVYQSGLSKQLNYQKLRFIAMLRSPAYFNSSLFDTLSGEYYRSKKNKADYYHLFDYWRWDEKEINDCLDSYGWERATDTSTTWRIGDGTAAFYNYVYHRVAGFSEHDTFRSNQIREGDISRDEALKLVRVENLPRYQNISWYLEVLGLPFEEVIKKVNSIPRLR
jgi:glucosamine--fructose-6-phosphate aminotransferase (isomerizing)